MNYIFPIGIIGITAAGLFYSKNIYAYIMRKINEEIMKKVNKELNNRLSNENSFKPNKTKSAVISLTHMGKTHSIYLPYDRNKSTSMLTKKVFLIKENEKIDITQKPGIPYLVSAEQLGGESIVVENRDGDVLYTYEKDKIPDCF